MGSVFTAATLGSGIAVAGAGCQPDPVRFEGEFGRAIPLASGADPLPPYFMFIPEGCSSGIPGGCTDPSRPCRPLLLDSLAPLSAIQDPTVGETRMEDTCVELREAAGMAAEVPTAAARDAAVTRFRFHDLPALMVAPEEDAWTWWAGDQRHVVEAGAILGGNLLNDGAVAIRWPRGGLPEASFFVEFPGSDQSLADQGHAAIAVQFPGRLLGRDISDRCVLPDGRECVDDSLNANLRFNSAIEASRMVVDACLAVPPCRVHYERADDPLARGACSSRPGYAPTECAATTDLYRGGKAASLIVATTIPGLALFEDSATRMFGDLAALAPCAEMQGGADTALACREGNAGALYVAGWRPAGDPAFGDPPLLQLRVRSVALVPGLPQSQGLGPCERAQERIDALRGQCDAYVEALSERIYVEDTTPPYTSTAPARTGTALAVLGEAHWTEAIPSPSADRWIPTLVVPVDHPLALVLRRDVSPEAAEPDGLLGTALFDDTNAVLDYTEGTPTVRVSCLDPRSGDCMVAPRCDSDREVACCYGLPIELIAEFIVTGDDDTCCAALSETELLEIRQDGHCLRTSPP